MRTSKFNIGTSIHEQSQCPYSIHGHALCLIFIIDRVLSSPQAVEQEIDGTQEEIDATEEIIQLMNEYLVTEFAKPQYNSVRYLCINKESLCAFWASVGECTQNESFMNENCSLACRSCHILLPDEKRDEL